MKKSDKELLKKALGARANSSESSIDLPAGPHWAISGIEDPIRFFENLHKLLPANSVLCVEGTEMDHVVTQFYKSNIYPTPAVIRHDTIFPTPQTFHMEFSKTLCERLLHFAQRLPSEALFDHMKGYHGSKMIFTFHDAFSGVLRIAYRTSEQTVAEFSKAIGGFYSVDTIESEDRALLKKLLEKMGPD
ncbi:MAG TPA: hypothetical protein VGO67_08760 [Verrucomicrobiae bacterium]|jgi:hypothetical protein